MAKDVVVTREDFLASKIFFNSALPLVKVICESVPKFGNKFKGKNFVFQVSAKYDQAEGGVMATHFVIEDGVWNCYPSKIHEKPDIEFAFSNLKKFVLFFSGKGMPLPKIKGFCKIGKLIAILTTLLKMASLLQAKEPPKSDEDKKLLVKLFLFLLPSGISQLNKNGYEEIHNWALTSPDRAYAWKVTGYDDLNSHIRVKAGKTKAGRGEYKRCAPFLTMKFDSIDHALDILMERSDMMDYMKKKFLIIEGAPEFGAIVGDFMLKVAYYAQGRYMN